MFMSGFLSGVGATLIVSLIVGVAWTMFLLVKFDNRLGVERMRTWQIKQVLCARPRESA